MQKEKRKNLPGGMCVCVYVYARRADERDLEQRVEGRVVRETRVQKRADGERSTVVKEWRGERKRENANRYRDEIRSEKKVPGGKRNERRAAEKIR